MNKVYVDYTMLCSDAFQPESVHGFKNCFDLFAVERELDTVNNVVKYHTGLVFNIPEGYVGLIIPRHGILSRTQSFKESIGMITNATNSEVVITMKYDIEHYIEEWKEKSKLLNFIFKKVFSRKKNYMQGEKIARLLILPYPEVMFREVDLESLKK